MPLPLQAGQNTRNMLCSDLPLPSYVWPKRNSVTPFSDCTGRFCPIPGRKESVTERWRKVWRAQACWVSPSLSKHLIISLCLFSLLYALLVPVDLCTVLVAAVPTPRKYNTPLPFWQSSARLRVKKGSPEPSSLACGICFFPLVIVTSFTGRWAVSLPAEPPAMV